MVNAALFFAEVYLIFSATYKGINWVFGSQIMLFSGACAILSAVISDYFIKKRIRVFRSEHGDVITDELVGFIKNRRINFVIYSAAIVFLGGGAFLWVAFPEFPLHFITASLFAVFCYSSYFIYSQGMYRGQLERIASNL